MAEKLEGAGQRVTNLRIVASAPSNPLNELRFGKTVRQHVRETGCVFAIVLLGIAGYIALKAGSLANIAACFVAALVVLAVAYGAPRAFLPVWRSWMTLAELLGHVVTFVILSVMWFGVFLPVAFALRLVGKKVMNMKFREQIATYWEDRKPELSDFKLLERQF